MRKALKALPFVAFLSLLLPPAAGAFGISLPADSAVTIDSPSRLVFRVTNAGGEEGLSRLTLRFPSGYRVTTGSPPPGWTVERSPSEISFRTTDEATCTGAIAPGSSLVFGVEVIAPASRAVTPDSLVSAQGEQSCRGMVLDPPTTLPSWNRLGMEAALAAGPPVLGLGGDVTVTMTVSNLSTVELMDISALLRPAGTGSLSGLTGPTPGTLSLAPGGSGSMTWTARAASAGTVSFAGQAVSKSVTSPPVGSDTLVVGDLDVSLTIAPEEAISGQDVQAQMTVTNRSPIRVTNVTSSPLAFEGTAVSSAAAGPSPSSQAVLEPGESATFAWVATISGGPGETYAFSGWASAEGGSIVSQNATSNQGVLGQPQVASAPDQADGSGLLGGGSDGGAVASGATTGGSAPAPTASASLQFIGVNDNGSSTGGTQFFGGVLRDLRILVGWQNLSGGHTQRLEIFAPDGSLYQRLVTQFTGTPVERRLPVGGTWITQHSLFGAWRVEVFLDSQQMPITSGVFVLTP